MSAPCPSCGCMAPTGAATHAVMAALLRDDLNLALDLGLLGETCCAHCVTECRAHVQASRRERLAALAARERYRARAIRLGQRAMRRANATEPGQTVAPSLPQAAALALSRAKAKATSN